MLQRRIPLGGSTTIGDVRVTARAVNPSAPPEKRTYRVFYTRADQSEQELERAHDGHNSSRFTRCGNLWLRLESVQASKGGAIVSYKMSAEPTRRERAKARRRLAARKGSET